MTKNFQVLKANIELFAKLPCRAGKSLGFTLFSLTLNIYFWFQSNKEFPEGHSNVINLLSFYWSPRFLTPTLFKAFTAH